MIALPGHYISVIVMNMKICVGSLLLTLLSFSRGEERCCEGVGCFNDEYPFDHLPLPQCSDVIKPSFKLYTNQNRDGQTITRDRIPSSYDTYLRTVVLIHGYQNDGKTNWVINVKEKLLDRGDYNVIIADWKNGASTLWYPQSASNTRLVGKEAAILMDALIDEGTSSGDIWCVGHSLGAHTCGHAGKTAQIGRITGLDPAGPLFENYPNEAGLWKSDARFVDVIHTFGKEGFIIDFGTLKPLGHVDFYPNGGKIQPGCSNYFYKSMEAVRRGQINYGNFGDVVGCSHGRANEYFAESISSDCSFTAQSICSNERNIPGSCRECYDCQRMGFGASPDKPQGKYFLKTNSASPFCKS